MNTIQQTFCFSVLFLVSGFSLYGCSAAKPPKAEIAQAEQIVDTALRGRVPRYAPSEFKLAQDKLAQAKVEMERRNYEQARRLSEQARADAEFAMAKAEAEYAAEQMKETSKGAHEMRSLPR
jgi:hypothetical protein